MKIAVTTPTGHVGGAVVDFLLEAGADVRMLCRRPEKLQKFVDRGAKCLKGSQDDVDFLIRCTEGIDALFWVTPPGYGSDDVRTYQNRMGKAGAEAIYANRIPRVVNLSSVGAFLAWGVGPISGLHDVEIKLDRVTPNILHLRPGYFFENYLWQVENLKNDGCICLPVSGARRCPMIATRDIARVATDWLLDGHWAGHRVRELHGPTDLSFDEAAVILGKGLDRRIFHKKVTPSEARQNMIHGGMSEAFADQILELYEAFERRIVQKLEWRSPDTTTRTTLLDFTRKVIVPLMAEPVAH